MIELMIVVAVISILTLVALPSYNYAVLKGRRGDAKGDLVQIAQALERCYTANNSYALACSGTTTGPNALATTPVNLTVAPQQGTTVYYNISLTNNARSTYTLSAVPTGPQASDPCGTLTLDQTGAKTSAVPSYGGSNCW